MTTAGLNLPPLLLLMIRLANRLIENAESQDAAAARVAKALDAAAVVGGAVEIHGC